MTVEEADRQLATAQALTCRLTAQLAQAMIDEYEAHDAYAKAVDGPDSGCDDFGHMVFEGTLADLLGTLKKCGHDAEYDLGGISTGMGGVL